MIRVHVQSDAGTYFLVVKRGSTFAYGLGGGGEMFDWILRRLFVQKNCVHLFCTAVCMHEFFQYLFMYVISPDFKSP